MEQGIHFRLVLHQLHDSSVCSSFLVSRGKGTILYTDASCQIGINICQISSDYTWFCVQWTTTWGLSRATSLSSSCDFMRLQLVIENDILPLVDTWRLCPVRVSLGISSNIIHITLIIKDYIRLYLIVCCCCCFVCVCVCVFCFFLTPTITLFRLHMEPVPSKRLSEKVFRKWYMILLGRKLGPIGKRYACFDVFPFWINKAFIMRFLVYFS